MRWRAHVLPAPGKLARAMSFFDLAGRNLLSIQRLSARGAGDRWVSTVCPGDKVIVGGGEALCCVEHTVGTSISPVGGEASCPVLVVSSTASLSQSVVAMVQLDW